MRVVRVTAKILGSTIIFTLVFSFIEFGIGLFTLDMRVNGLLNQIEGIVADNNYLPSDTNSYVESRLDDLMEQMSGRADVTTDDFIVGWSINSSAITPNVSSVVGGLSPVSVPSISGINIVSDLSTPANLGDVQVVDIIIYVQPPLVTNLFDSMPLHFVALVPCQRYIR